MEGTVNEKKIRIILCYFDCTKKMKGGDFKRNRGLQKKVERFIDVEPGTNLIVLGDINGRLTKLELILKLMPMEEW